MINFGGKEGRKVHYNKYLVLGLFDNLKRNFKLIFIIDLESLDNLKVFNT